MAKAYKDQMKTLTSQRVFEPYREALAIAPASLRDLVRTTPDELRSEAQEPLMELADILGDAAVEDPEVSTFDWLAWLPPIAQRRMFLLALGVLIAAENAVYAVAEVEPPGHIDKIVQLLFVIAGFLSELIEFQSSDDEDDEDESVDR